MNEFTAAMALRTDAELLEIVGKDRADYTAEAIEAAEAELQKRNLSSEKVELAEKEIKRKEADILEKAQAPLESHWKILMFLAPGILALLIAGTYKADGFDQKYKESWKWTLYGIGFYVSMVILFIIFMIFLVN